MKKPKNSKSGDDGLKKIPDPDLIKRAAEALKKGGAVVFPTRGLYGLGVDALSLDAVEKIFAIKKRSRENPLLILVEDLEAVRGLVTDIPPAGEKIARRFWPGRVTVVLKAAAHLPENLTAKTGKIGVRIPGHPAARALVRALGGPMTGTSANLSGSPGCRRVSDIPEEILRACDWVLDAGALEGGQGSTVVDVTLPEPAIIRQGAVLKADLFS
jgi:L-threonylcarbamoyladenylate synthase